MGLRANVVKAELALGVGDDEGAVFHVQANIRNAAFFGILNAIAVAVSKDLADDKAPVTKDAWQHLHGGGSDVADLGRDARGDPRTKRLGTVDTVTLQGSRAHADAVAQGWCRSILNGARIKNQLGAHAAFGLRKPGAIQTHGACVKAGAVGHIGKAGRQVVFKLDLTQKLAAAVLDLDAVVNKLAQIDRVSRSDFFNEQATQVARVERHVDMHWPRCQINRELAAVGAFWIG